MNKKLIGWIIFDLLIVTFVILFDRGTVGEYTGTKGAEIVPKVQKRIVKEADVEDVGYTSITKPLTTEEAVGGVVRRHKKEDVVESVGELKRYTVKEQTKTFKITAYCPCSRCSGSYGGITSTGVRAVQGRTIAVDPNVIPYGTHVRFNGNEYVAEDCGGVIKGNHIDLYFESHAEALEWGKKYCEIEILKGE